MLVRQQLTCLIAGEVLFADVLLLPNGMSKVGAYVLRWWCFWFYFG